MARRHDLPSLSIDGPQDSLTLQQAQGRANCVAPYMQLRSQRYLTRQMALPLALRQPLPQYGDGLINQRNTLGYFMHATFFQGLETLRKQFSKDWKK
jgi:hypothetical protein